MKNHDQRLVIFDIDWTLLKGGLAEHVDGFNFAWKKVLGIEAHLSDWKDHHGKPDCVLLSEIPRLTHHLPLDLIQARLEELKTAKTEYFFQHCRDDYRSDLMEGVIILLSKLKELSIPLAIKSGNLEKIGWYRLEKAGIKSYFTDGGFGDDVLSKTESLEIAISRVSLILKRKYSRDQVFDIGDSKYDVLADKEKDIKSIAVCTGFDGAKLLKQNGADLTVDNLTFVDDITHFITKQY